MGGNYKISRAEGRSYREGILVIRAERVATVAILAVNHQFQFRELLRWQHFLGLAGQTVRRALLGLSLHALVVKTAVGLAVAVVAQVDLTLLDFAVGSHSGHSTLNGSVQIASRWVRNGRTLVRRVITVAPRVLRIVISQVRARHRAAEPLRARGELRHVLVSQIFEVGHLDQLAGRGSVVCVVRQHFQNHFLGLRRNVWNQLCDADEFFSRELQLHVSCVLLELVEKLLRGRAQDVVYFVDLVELVLTGKEWEKREHFEKDATDAPDVHLVTIVAVGHQTFRCSIPSGRNVLSQRGLVVQATTATQICQFDCLA